MLLNITEIILRIKKIEKILDFPSRAAMDYDLAENANKREKNVWMFT